MSTDRQTGWPCEWCGEVNPDSRAMCGRCKNVIGTRPGDQPMERTRDYEGSAAEIARRLVFENAGFDGARAAARRLAAQWPTGSREWKFWHDDVWGDVAEIEADRARSTAPRSVSCGCCTGGCVCEHHHDVPRGRMPVVCAYHWQHDGGRRHVTEPCRST